MRGYAFIPLALAGVTACSSDSLVPADAGADALSNGSRNDGSVQGEASGPSRTGGGADGGSVDGGSVDRGSADRDSVGDGSADGGPPDANDAGGIVAKITSSLGSTGDIDIYNDHVTATFYEDDTIIRSDAAPDCVVHVRSGTKPFSPAGTLTIGGPIVGSDGGTASILKIKPDATGFYSYDGPVFPATDDLVLQVEASPTLTFPAMSVQSLRLPPANPIVVTQPPLPDSGDLAIPSTQPLAIAWTVPSGAKPDLRVGLQFLEIGGNGSKLASLYCSFPLSLAGDAGGAASVGSAGAGQVPAELLSEIKNRVGANASGLMEVFVGSQLEFTSMGASYVIAVLRPDTLGLQVQGDLQ